MFKKVFVLVFVLFLSKSVSSQCSFFVTSTNGWTATISYNVTSIAVFPNGSPCGSYYKFAPVVTYTVTFSGSNTSRSITLQNMCINCMNQNQSTVCQDCNSSIGTFTGNSIGTVTVNNNNCEYDASYDGAGHPYYPAPKVDCAAMNLAYAQCTSGKVDATGNGVPYTSNIPCSGINPLPIELLNFGAKLTNGKVYLNWSTATETNNKYFTIEKSTDGIYFEEVTSVNGAGNSIKILNYSEVDPNPYGGISYYRLKQTDNNGDFKYFPIVSVENKITVIIISNIHPNPTTTGNFSFDIYSPNKGTLRIQLIDNVGRNIFDNTQAISDNQSKINIETTSIPLGIYILKTSFLETGVTLVNKIIKN